MIKQKVIANRIHLIIKGKRVLVGREGEEHNFTMKRIQVWQMEETEEQKKKREERERHKEEEKQQQYKTVKL